MKKIILSFLAIFFLLKSNAQNVGIGITNPQRAKLELNGVAGHTAAMFGGDGSGISLIRSWPSIGFNMYYNSGHKYMKNGFAAMQYVDQDFGHMAFDIFNTGIADGNATPTAKRILTLTPNASFWLGPYPHNSSLSVPKIQGLDIAAACFRGTTYHSAFNTYPFENTFIRAGKEGGTVFINDENRGKVMFTGSVGINTATPVFPLEIRILQDNNGSHGLALVDPDYFNSWEVTLVADGSQYFRSNNGSYGYFRTDGSYYAASDLRLKKDIERLAPSLSKLNKLRPVSYELIHNNPRHDRSIGFLAQELKSVFPELVTVQQGSKLSYGIHDLHTLNYSGLHAIVIKAIQEREDIIKKREAEIAELEQKYAELLIIAEKSIK